MLAWRVRACLIGVIAVPLAGCLLPAVELLSGSVGASGDGGPDVQAPPGFDAESGADVGEASAPAFCPNLNPAPKFCDDFDRPPTKAWSSTDVLAGGTVAVDGTAFTSAPNALLTTTPGADYQVARRTLSIPNTSHVHVSYRVRVEQFGTYAEVGYVRVAAAGHPSQFYFRVSSLPQPVSFATEALPPDGGVIPHQVTLAGAPTFDTWRKVEVDLTFGSANVVTVKIDGSIVGVQNLESDLYVAGAVTVDVGTGYVDKSSTAFKIRYDDVTIDWN